MNVQIVLSTHKNTHKSTKSYKIIDMLSSTSAINPLQLYKDTSHNTLRNNLKRICKEVSLLAPKVQFSNTNLKMFLVGFYQHEKILDQNLNLAKHLTYHKFPNLTTLSDYLLFVKKNKSNYSSIQALQSAFKPLTRGHAFNNHSSLAIQIDSLLWPQYKATKNAEDNKYLKLPKQITIVLNMHALSDLDHNSVLHTLLLNCVAFFQDYAMTHRAYNFQLDIKSVEDTLDHNKKLATSKNNQKQINNNVHVQKKKKSQANQHKAELVHKSKIKDNEVTSNKKQTNDSIINAKARSKAKHKKINLKKIKHHEKQNNEIKHKLLKKRQKALNTQKTKARNNKPKMSETKRIALKPLITELYFDNVVLNDFQKTKIDMALLKDHLSAQLYKSLKIDILAEKQQFSQLGKDLIKIMKK